MTVLRRKALIEMQRNLVAIAGEIERSNAQHITLNSAAKLREAATAIGSLTTLVDQLSDGVSLLDVAA